MDSKTEKEQKNKIAKSKYSFSLKHRITAMLLALLMLFGSSGMSILALGNDGSEPNSINLQDYLTDKTVMQITVWVDGTKYVCTPEELSKKDIEIAKGSPVKVELYFDTIYGVKKGQTLEYQLPENLMDYSGANEYGYVWKDTVWEENNAGADVEAADWVIDNTGKLTVTIRDDFFDSNKHDDDTVDLFGFNIKFSGSLSSERGEHSGNGDNVITFRDETNGTGKIQFTIPFEYKNEHANVLVEKNVVNYDPTTRTASYEIKVTAPDTNEYTATNVVVTDKVLCDTSLLAKAKDSNGKTTSNYYQNYVASTGADTFDYENCKWTIGEMTPGQQETLTYNLVLASDCYKDGSINEIENIATVTFNDDGENTADCILQLPGTVINKQVNYDENGNMLTTENGETYITYTLTATANDGDATGIIVKDAFSNPDRISKIIIPDDGASQGNVDVDDETASLTWYVGKLKEGKTATLTYRAYVNPDVWQITQDSQNPGTVSLKLNNSAKLYVSDDDSEYPVLTDTITTSNDWRKVWVNKQGSLVTDTKDEKNGLMKFVVSVNGDPVSKNITSIYDVLTGGTYESGGNLEVNRYTSSDKTNLVDTTTIPLSDVVTATDNGYRWDIDLVSRKLNGPYYYEVIYYVQSSSVMVNNSAGIGFGTGTGYGKGVTTQGSGGMTYGTDYTKSFDRYDNKKEAYSQWYVTIQKTVPEGAIYCDWLSSEYVYKHEQFWFDDDALNDITITFEGNTLTQGVDYTVEGVRANSTDADRTDPNKERYYMFKITFNNEYLASSSNKMVISYKVRLNNEPRDEDCLSYSDKCVVLYYNYCRWYLPEYGNLVATSQAANYSHSSYVANTPLQKGNGTYNESDGTITWYLTVNTQTSIEGDATLEEYLPAGLSFVSAEISNKPFPAVSGNTTLGDITQETYTDNDGNECTKVNIPIKDLVSYTVTSSIYKTADNPNGVGPTIYWSRAGEITIKLVTKVDTEWLLNLNKNTVLTNTAYLTNDSGMNVKATGTATVPATQEIEKTLVGRDIPAYIEYALNVNPDGKSLVSNDDNTLEVVDIMDDGMKMTTEHSNYFKVYDVTDVSDLLDSDGNVIPSKAQTGTDVTSSCSVEEITGQSIDGMTEDEVGKPTYLITVPDGKHLVVLYWATFEGADGDSVTISNRASFFYNGKLQDGSGDKTSNSVVASEASSSLFVGPFFNLKKTDQWGNMVPDVTYTLYEVQVDSDGNETGRTAVMTKTTTSDEILYFGHRTQDGSNVPELSKNKLYCLVEESAPAGYDIDSEPYYFEFKEKDHDVVDHPSDVTLHQFVSGGTYSFTNQFEAGSYAVSVKKTINGKNVESDTQFSFTLKQYSGSTTPAYTDDNCTTQISTDGIKATISGSGETQFAPLYFKEVGTYSFLLTEDDLSTEATNNGYTKDSNTFLVKIVVDKGANNELAVTQATFISQDSSKDSGDFETSLPTFDNGSHLSGTITLNATKVVENRTKAVQAGEFAFKVSVDGEVIAEKNADGTTKLDADGKPVKQLFYTKDGGDIEINIDIDQDDVGTHTYVISEVSGDDPSITYSNERVKVKVTIAEAGNGRVAATNYEYLNDAVFTNEYSANGSVSFVGTKVLKGNRPLSIQEDEFTFTVKENNKVVATGKTLKGGEIEFEDIKYTLNDVGTHVYVISEDQGNEKGIVYSEDTVTVVVDVSDNGDGNLITKVSYPINGITFVNQYVFSVPSGINLEILPYILVAAAVSLSIALAIIVINRKRKSME